MGILNKFRHQILKKKLVINEENNYSDEVIALKEKIINGMPDNLSQLKKAYYVYRELGKELSENPANVFDFFCAYLLSEKPIDGDFQGNCKAIASLYVDILRDKRVGVEADLITISQELGSHVDAIIKDGDKEYITNLIGDLSRIQTGKKTHYFGFNLQESEAIMYSFNSYKKIVKKCYPNLQTIPRETLDKFDKELGYSYSAPSEKDSEKPGIYTEDVFDRIREELQDPKKFKKYVLNGKDNIPEEDILKYKLEFFLENMDKFSTYPGKDPRALENIRYYYYTLKKFFTREEGNRLDLFTTSTSLSEFSNLNSVIRLRTPKGNKIKKDYYIYVKDDSTGKGKYQSISKEELKEFFKNNVIVGQRDIFNPIDVSNLEL